METVKRSPLCFWGVERLSKALFLTLGLAMAVAALWSFVRPLWRQGFKGLAVFAGLFIAALFSGLAYLIGTLAR